MSTDPQDTPPRRTRHEALASAKRWFSEPTHAVLYDSFQARYLDMVRTLFLEVALHELGHPPRRVLDIGCGPGDALNHLAQRLPEAELVGVDPEAEMVQRARERVGGRARVVQTTLEDFADEGRFDLILSYSNFRFWDAPAVALAKIAARLDPRGLAYIQDLHGDVDAALRAELLHTMDSPSLEEFMAAQLDSAHPLAEVRQFIEAARLSRWTLKVGGLAGHPQWSREAFSLIQYNDRISQLIFQLPTSALRSPRGSESVFHLFIRGEEAVDGAE